ncbi:hypothetical protein [Pseudomonas viridiflava]|uniref:hypothetical protein n=1 Tax=Pseudomonas viridiflava TaxID=33069 RepID=UPI001E2A140F|nr:hypothetical protein [Pseudomonas viridiflava]MEE4106727.1 hypothetical protein [Pseudomonas viridiflava]
MTYINLPSNQQAAISDVDETALWAAVRKCLDEERIGPIHGFGLTNCGPYVANKLHGFQQAITEYSKAKAHAKCERTRQDALYAGNDLVHAMQQMKGSSKLSAKRGNCSSLMIRSGRLSISASDCQCKCHFAGELHRLRTGSTGT